MMYNVDSQIWFCILKDVLYYLAFTLGQKWFQLHF